MARRRPRARPATMPSPTVAAAALPDIDTDPAAALRAARDPGVDAESLRAVAAAALPPRPGSKVGPERRAVLAAVAAHPNSPPDVLARAAFHAPAAFCRNPAAPLVPLEDPSWIASVGEPTLVRILRQGGAPAALVGQIAAGAAEGGAATAAVTEEARLHVAFAGECPTAEWVREVRDHWRSHVAAADDALRDAYAEFALVGILPDWVAGEDTDARRALSDARERLWRAADPQAPEAERRARLRDPFWTVSLAAVLAGLRPGMAAGERYGILQGMYGARSRGFRDQILEDIRRRTFQTDGEVHAACVEALLLAATVVRDDCPARPLAAFGGAMKAPQRIEDPASEAADTVERWPRLLGYVLGISPRSDGRWGDKTGAALEALSQDGNRWVRAAARARLRDSSITFSW